MKQRSNDSLYADPAIYDILYAPDTWREVDALERIERRYAREAGRSLSRDRFWFEPACGSGRYLRCAARRGRRTAGFDLDQRMLDYAAARKLPANARPPRLFRADMADCLDAARAAGIRPGSVDFGFNPVNSIRHLASDRAVLAHLDQTAELLKPGGLYVVGLSLTDYANLLPEEDLWTAARGQCRVTQLVNYLPPEPGTKQARTERVLSVFSSRLPHVPTTRNCRRTRMCGLSKRPTPFPQWRNEAMGGKS